MVKPPNPTRLTPNGLQDRFGQGEVFLGRDLQVGGGAGHQVNRVSGCFEELGIIRNVGAKLVASGVGGGQPVAAKDLRRLRQPQALPGYRRLHPALAVIPLYGIGNRHR